MKTKLIIAFFVGLCTVLNGAYNGNLIYHVNDPLGINNTDEVEPYISVDQENESYSLVLTCSGGENAFQPKIIHAYYDSNSYQWTHETIRPDNYTDDYLQPRIHIDNEANEILTYRRSFDFNSNNFYNQGTWRSYNRNTQLHEYNEISFNLLSKPGLNGSIHFLSRTAINNIPKLLYYLRNEDGVYSSSTNIFSTNSPQFLMIHPSLVDLTHDTENNPIVCYVIQESTEYKIMVNQNNQNTTVSQIISDGGDPFWNTKMHRLSSPSIAYNHSTGTTIIVYSSYDTSNNLWSLYYSFKENGSNWTNPCKVFSNSKHVTQPYVVADKNNGNFYIAFMYFDNSDNQVDLQLIGYSNEIQSFWNEPIAIGDLGNITHDGNMNYQSDCIHMVALPYEEDTELVIASIRFMDRTVKNTGIIMYSVNFPNTAQIAFKNIIKDDSVPGQMKLINNSTSTTQTFDVPNTLQLSTEISYTLRALTDIYD
jgi:hypothetical protein